MDNFVTSIVTVLMAVIGVAIISVLVSPRAQTPQVLQAGGTAFAGILQAAEAPVSSAGGINIPGVGSF
jgi:hypothetical protein